MKRRDFLHLGLTFSALLITLRSLGSGLANAAGEGAKTALKLKDSDILKEGAVTTIANYCENPGKQPNKFCPTYKDKPGRCDNCMFYNKDKSQADHKDGQYARCQLLTTPGKPQFVSAKAWCATYAKQP